LCATIEPSKTQNPHRCSRLICATRNEISRKNENKKFLLISATLNKILRKNEKNYSNNFSKIFFSKKNVRSHWQSGARRGLPCYSVFAKNVSVFAENVFVFARRCQKGLIEARWG
jgi:hypothetical protein